jgi:hypothetical protein
MHVGIEREPPQGCDRRCAECVHLGCLGAITVEEVARAALRAVERSRSAAAADVS